MRFLKLGAWCLLAVLGTATVALLIYRHVSQPQHSGSIAVTLTSGRLADAVQIERDSWGIPSIRAKSLDDAWFAVGFAHGQDRLWQMEMNRRIANGELAEVLGPSALDSDKFLRTLGVARAAAAQYERLDAATKLAMQRYADGVNAAAAQYKTLPPEFLLVGTRPKPWKPQDSLGWAIMMAWDLGGNWTSELTRMRLSGHLSVPQIEQLLPPISNLPVPTGDYSALYRTLGLQSAQAAATPLLAMMPSSGIEGLGSNNWVVSGSRTSTGKPLLANDPHLSLNVPAIWYFVRIEAEGLQITGSTLPGLPFVVIGRNQHVAWGVTNTGSDVQDLFIERFNPADPNSVLGPNGLEPTQLVLETIQVKGEKEVPLNVRVSPRGPLISDVHAASRKLLGDSGYGLSFRWAALDADNVTVRAGIQMNRARNATEFEAALRDFAAPMQNFVFADTAGNIGTVSAGRVPVRRADNDLNGLAPAPAWEARYAWQGYLPFEQLPREINPARGYIATANHNITPEGYAHFLTSEWALPFRQQRIMQLIEAKTQHDAQSMMVLQADTLSLASPAWLRLVQAAGGLAPQTQPGKDAWALLQSYDGNATASRAEPLIYTAWLKHAAERLFADEVGKAQYEEVRSRRDWFAAVLLATSTGSAMCDDVSTPATETCAQTLSAAMDDAAAYLAKEYGGKPAKWQWGKAHVARSEHRPLGKSPLAALFDIRVPSPGDAYTVNVGRPAMGGPEPFLNVHSASLRAVYDLATPQAAWMMHSTGQGGHRLHPNYSDMSKPWSRVEFIDIAQSRVASTLTLVPQ
jgi:penicillin amidase